MAEKVADHSKLDTEVKVKKTRASKPKVKTGCQTCKFVFAFTSFSFVVPLVVQPRWTRRKFKVEEDIAKLVQQLEYAASSAMRLSPAVCVA
jgi:hypothetical protein